MMLCPSQDRKKAKYCHGLDGTFWRILAMLLLQKPIFSRGRASIRLSLSHINLLTPLRLLHANRSPSLVAPPSKFSAAERPQSWEKSRSGQMNTENGTVLPSTR